MGHRVEASGWDSTRRVDQMMSSRGDGTGTIEANVAGKTVTGATNATPIVVTATAHGYSDGDFVWLQSVGGNLAANGLHVVANKADNTFELTTPEGEDVAGSGAYTSGGDSFLAFVIRPPSGLAYGIERLNLEVGDNANPDVESYLGLAKMTNGIEVRLYQDTTLIHTLTSGPVKNWNGWARMAGTDVPVLDIANNKTEAAVRWTFTKSSPQVWLSGSDGELLAVVIRDDMDALVYQRIAAQGVQVESG